MIDAILLWWALPAPVTLQAELAVARWVDVESTPERLDRSDWVVALISSAAYPVGMAVVLAVSAQHIWPMLVKER